MGYHNSCMGSFQQTIISIHSFLKENPRCFAVVVFIVFVLVVVVVVVVTVFVVVVVVVVVS